MANADGSVIFSCDLDSTKAQKKLSKLRDEISELNSKLEKETGNKLNLEKQLDAASQAAKATEERVKMLRKEVERLNDREWIFSTSARCASRRSCRSAASIAARSRRLACWIESRNGSGCRFRPISSSARTGTFCSTAAGTAI